MGNIIIAISIHALREEGDSACPALVGSAQEFLSTPSARRATKPRRRERSRQNISIHALREEGDAAGDGTGRQFLSTPSARRATDTLPTLSTAWMISIHALREEGDELLLWLS